MFLGMLLDVYVFYVCANFEVMCSLLRIIKSKWPPFHRRKREKNIFCFFFILFQTDLNKYTMKLIVLKIKLKIAP